MDPHFWQDPVLVSELIDPLVEAIGLTDTSCADAYKTELEKLHEAVEAKVDTLAEQDRLLVTNHHAFQYYAERYDFKILGTVIPSSSDLAETNPADLEELAQTVKETKVKAVFSEDQHSSIDTNALAERVDVKVYILFSGALGPEGSGAETYIDLVTTNTERIVNGLAGK